MTVKKVFTVCANRNLLTLMFKSKLQWEVTIVCHGVRIFWTSLSKWPSSFQRRCWCDFFTKRVKGGVKERRCCGSALVVMWIRIQHFSLMRIRIRIQWFDDQTFHNLTVEKKSKFFIKNCIPRDLWRASKLQEKPPALKGEHPALQKQYISSLFVRLFVGHFCCIRIQIQPTKIYAIRNSNTEERSSLFASLFCRVADIWLLYMPHTL